jgi:hypothetical protein
MSFRFPVARAYGRDKNRGQDRQRGDNRDNRDRRDHGNRGRRDPQRRYG